MENVEKEEKTSNTSDELEQIRSQHNLMIEQSKEKDTIIIEKEKLIKELESKYTSTLTELVALQKGVMGTTNKKEEPKVPKTIQEVINEFKKDK